MDGFRVSGFVTQKIGNTTVKIGTNIQIIFRTKLLKFRIYSNKIYWKPTFREDNPSDSEFHTGAEDNLQEFDSENEPDPNPSAGTSTVSSAGYYQPSDGSSRITTPASSPPRRELKGV